VIPLKDNVPTGRFPVVTVALILVNIAVFLWQGPTGFGSVDDSKVVRYGAIPYELTHPGKHCALGTGIGPGGRVVDSPQGGEHAVACEGKAIATSGGQQVVRHVPGPSPATWLTVLAAMFMHGGILHIAGNMLFLWIFGNNVEDSMGRVRFVAFYVLGGLAALAAQVAIDPGSTVPTIGASGAIAAVLGGYLLLFPRAKVLCLVFIIFLFTVIELPAILMLAFWFLQQLFFGATNLSHPVGGGGGVAYFAHIGGFVFGLALIRLFVLGRGRHGPRAALPVG